MAELERIVREHRGEFLCERIADGRETKLVSFSHIVHSAGDKPDVPTFGRLREFYETFGSILFYHDEKSGDAGKLIAHPTQWAELHLAFSDWIDILDEEERQDCLPEWADNCLTIGETPQSGNYILVPATGSEAGKVFEFDHDGFEFTAMARDIVEYVEKLLKPDSSSLTEIASHMRFIEDDPMVQWWILEMRDNGGRVVSTKA